MSVYFWFMPKRLLFNKILGLLSLLWAAVLLIFVLQSKAFFCEFPHFYGLATGSVLLFFPLLFLFIKSYLDTTFKLVLRSTIHFVPLFIFIAFYSPFYFQSAVVKINFFTTQIPEWVRTLFLFTTVAVIIQGLVYSLLSVYLLQSYNVEDSATGVGKRKWLKQFIVINTLLWAIGVSAFLIEILDLNMGFDLFVVYYFGLTFMAIWVAYVSLQKPAYFIQNTGEIANEMILPSFVIDTAHYSPEIQSFIAFFEENKPYLDNELSLQKLSYLSGYPRNLISEMLNNQIGKSFYDFINEYRVEEFINLVKEGMHEKHTLTHLYESAGFNSKATFNRFFKKRTGFTPTNYIHQFENKV